MSLRVTLVDAASVIVYENLAQNYEAEFSKLTGKLPDSNGRYEYTEFSLKYVFYLLWDSGTPVGFAVLEICKSFADVAEFYIIPAKRRDGLGKYLAFWIFNHYPGYWQVRQIAGAHWARSFWLQVIAEFTEGDFLQFQQTDPVWGIVDVQTFQSKPQV